MSKITIVSAANGPGYYADVLKGSLKRKRELGYDERYYDLGGLGMGIPFSEAFGEPPPKDKIAICMAKPRFMLNALENVEGPILWMDADMLLLQPIEELRNNSYDVAIFYARRKRQKCFTAGSMFFNNTQASKNFLEEWIDKIRARDLILYPNARGYQLGDQIFLKDMIYQEEKRGDRFLNTIKEIRGARISFLDAAIYNSTKPILRNIPPGETKILHLCVKTAWKYAKEQGLL